MDELTEAIMAIRKLRECIKPYALCDCIGGVRSQLSFSESCVVRKECSRCVNGIRHEYVNIFAETEKYIETGVQD